MNKEVLSVAKDTAISFLGKAGGYILAVIFNIIVARKFGAKIYGDFIFVYSILCLFGLLIQLGNRNGLMYYLPRLNLDKKYIENKNLIVSTFKISVLFSVVLLFSILIFTEPISQLILGSSKYLLIVKIVAMIIVAESLIDILKASLRGNGDIKHFAFGGVLVGIIRILIIALFIILGVKKNALPMSYLGASILALFYYLWVLKKKGMFGEITSKSFQLFISMSLLFLPSMFTAFLSVIHQKVDKIMLGILLNSTAVGIYNIAFVIASLVSFFLIVLNSVISPIISKMYYEDNLTKLSEVFKISTRWVSSASFLFFFLILILNKEILHIFGKDFESGVTVLVFIALGQIFNSITGAKFAILNMTGNVKFNLYINLIAVIINIVFNLLLIPKYGMNGAAFATMSTLFILSSLTCIFIYKKLKIHPFSMKMIKQFLISGICFFISFLFYNSFNFHWKIGIIIIPLLLITLFIIFNLIIGLEEEDKMIFDKVIHRFSLFIRST